ncbi:hypothetical protein ASE61_15705 [Bosea sp. Root670]|uniref:Ivy family c-type lysozyme inhibitor n=1 Tax=Bosea sp. Root670 TaxID=1736583 RepID=UPI0007127956|nr:Ivy family c-type lysozyme inhibitor [Bosea sp. Root670]KRE02711.1 hypothetical protein ASE61_15705 [Bosea sp. Root670]
MSVRRLPFAIASAVALLLSVPASAQAPKDGGRYLHDLMKQPTYRDAWARMLGKLGPRESWLKADKLTGPGGPSTIVTVGGQAFERVDTCKRHDCGNNQFYALFSSDGREALGVLVQPGNIRFFGQPSEEQQRALVGP